MTDAAQIILDFAHRYDLSLDEVEIDLYFRNRAAIEKNPNDPEAKRIAQHFACIFYWAKDDITFDDFMNDPKCPPDCPECFAYDQRASDRSLKFLTRSPK